MTFLSVAFYFWLWLEFWSWLCVFFLFRLRLCCLGSWKPLLTFGSQGLYPRSHFMQCVLSCSVLHDSLQPHGLQHARLPCPSLSTRVCSNSCPLIQWFHLILCHPFFLLPSVFPSIRSWLFTLGGQDIGASAWVLPMNIQGWFPLGFTGMICLLSKGLSRVFSTPQFKSINSSALSLPYGPTLTSIHDYWKNHCFD